MLHIPVLCRESCPYATIWFKAAYPGYCSVRKIASCNASYQTPNFQSAHVGASYEVKGVHTTILGRECFHGERLIRFPQLHPAAFLDLRNGENAGWSVRCPAQAKTPMDPTLINLGIPTSADCPLSWMRKSCPQSVQHVLTPKTTR